MIRIRYSAGNSFGVSPRCRTEDTSYREHAHRVREIKPTIPWIAFPNLIAPFGGGVPGAICEVVGEMEAAVHVSRRTVDNNITRGPVDSQRWRIERFCWAECVRVIVDVPGIGKSKKLEGMKAERKYKWRCLNRGFSFWVVVIV